MEKRMKLMNKWGKNREGNAHKFQSSDPLTFSFISFLLLLFLFDIIYEEYKMVFVFEVRKLFDFIILQLKFYKKKM